MRPLTCYFIKIKKNNQYKQVRTYQEVLLNKFMEKIQRHLNDLNNILYKNNTY